MHKASDSLEQAKRRFLLPTLNCDGSNLVNGAPMISPPPPAASRPTYHDAHRALASVNANIRALQRTAPPPLTESLTI